MTGGRGARLSVSLSPQVGGVEVEGRPSAGRHGCNLEQRQQKGLTGNGRGVPTSPASRSSSGRGSPTGVCVCYGGDKREGDKVERG